jgi:hypothetical protein
MAVNLTVVKDDPDTGGLPAKDLVKMVDYASDEMDEAREQSAKCRRYYDHDQLTAVELAILRKRKQPPLIINRIQRKVDAMVGIEQKGRVDPRALPREPGDEDAADIATKALVFVDDVTRFDTHRSAFCYNLAIEGYGGVEVNVRDRQGQKDPDIIRLRWEEIFFDPYSRELDFSDADYMGCQKWMSLSKAREFCRGYNPDMPDEELDALLNSSMNVTSSTYEDRPTNASRSGWGDPKTKRVKLAYMYYRHEGDWRLTLFTGAGVIYDELSPFLDFSEDENGKPANAMILQACYIDQENKRYGIVTSMIPMQDEINARRSKLLHQLNSRQTMGQKGAIADMKILKRELALPDGHVEYDQDPSSSVKSFEVVEQTDQVAGQFQLLQESKGEIDMLGPNASLLGQLEGDQSGRAIIAQQQAGMAELAPFYDNLKDWTLRVYRAMWNRIRQFWREPRWVRVTDESEKLKFVGINQPAQQPAIDPMTGQPAMGPDGQPMMQPVMGPDGKPQIENPIAQLDVDIIIDMTPEYASLQMEEFQTLTDLVKTGMVQIPPDVLIEASQLRNKAKLLEKMRGDSPEAQAQQQAQQQAMQLEADERQATIGKITAEGQAIGAKAQLDAQLEPMRLKIEERKLALDEARMAFESRKMEIEAAAAERDAQSGAGEMPLKLAEVQIKGKLADADVGLKHAQTEKTLAEVGLTHAQAGKAKADVEIAGFQATKAAEHQDRQFGLEGQKLGLEDKRADADREATKQIAASKSVGSKGSEPTKSDDKKAKRSRFKVVRNDTGYTIDREDVG